MHDMFDLIINIIGTPCIGMSIVFTKVGFIHQMLQLSHINLHFNFKNSLQCIYLIINIIFTLLESIYIDFKVFLLIFDISIFIKKISTDISIKYKYRYIHKIQVPIYPSKPILLTLLRSTISFTRLLTSRPYGISRYAHKLVWTSTIIKKKKSISLNCPTAFRDLLPILG